AFRVLHLPDEQRLLLDRLLEKFFRAQADFSEDGVIEHDADARARGAERDNPEPAIDRAHHPRESAIAAFGALDTVVMREERNLLQVFVVFLELELRAYNRITAARIDDVVRGDLIGGTCFCVSLDERKLVPPRDGERHAFFRKSDRFD